ncbi:MAG: hypothetical protein AAGE59_29720 [Cyanobacteria bacterium P01_F01_bin.86]
MQSANSASHFTPPHVDRFLSALTWMNQRFKLSVPPIVTMDYLRSLPSGTFGKAWADYLEIHGLQPFAEGSRRQQLHDGIHVLTGYGTDPIGEVEVQAFLLGAKFRLVNVILMAGLLRSIHRQRRYRSLAINSAAVRSRLNAAYRRGQTAQVDPDTWRPEDFWHEPLSEVQKQLGL